MVIKKTKNNEHAQMQTHIQRCRKIIKYY